MLSFNRAHFVGVGGIGMSGIARVLLQMGMRVSGSDLQSSRITEGLERLGATIYRGHSASNVDGADLLVVSSAVPASNPELVEAQKRGIRIVQRGQMLSLLMETRKGIAVAGTHGKTTTTSMIANVLEGVGLCPTVVVGGELNDIGSNAKLGQGEYIVAEADESDASFVDLSPRIAVVTSIDPDVNLGTAPFADCGYDYDFTVQKVEGLFVDFMHRVDEQGLVVLCVDHERVKAVAHLAERRTITYGLSSEAELTARDISLADYASKCEVYLRGERLGELILRVPGRHNIQNALATIAVAMEVGCEFADIARHLAGFRGVQRRFQIIGQFDGVTVVDDYAHNPSKLKAAIHASRTGGAERVFAVFQPHRYTRTKFFMNEYSHCFDEADYLLVTDVYSAGEEAIEGADSPHLVRTVLEGGGISQVTYTPSHDDVLRYLAANCRSGDVVIFLGAGDISKCAARTQEVMGNNTCRA